MKHENDIVIVGAKRTPIGALLGQLKELTAVELGVYALQGAVEQANLDPSKIDDVVMGNVLSAGQGQAPARQVALGAGLSVSADCTTVNKMCGSGMKAVMMACQDLASGDHQLAAAGGIESMSQAPYLLPKARSGLRVGHASLIDHMFHDGLEDAYDKGQLMGVYAETCAKKYNFSREEQDRFALSSLSRAQEAARNNEFSDEIVPIIIKTKEGEVVIDKDELPQKAKAEKIPLLKPAFSKEGTVTAANSSSISDGAACLILTTRKQAKELALKPLARIVDFTTFSQKPEWFTTAPIAAIEKLVEKIRWQINEVDLFEVNEAFAVVAMAAMKDLAIPHEKLNVRGGACALGHPIGASGARILVTLLSSLRQKKLKRGIASLCIGGGEATAMALELES